MSISLTPRRPLINTSPVSQTRQIFRFDGIEFDENGLELRIDNRPVIVEPKPLQVLSILLDHCDKPVRKELIFHSIWHDRPTVDHVLANAIHKLRSALGERAGSRIINIPKVGYRLQGPVEKIAIDIDQASPPKHVAHGTQNMSLALPSDLLQKAMSLCGESIDSSAVVIQALHEFIARHEQHHVLHLVGRLNQNSTQTIHSEKGRS